MLESGQLALSAQESIVDIGKDATQEEGETHRTFLKRNAKTEMDIRVQEMLLHKIKKDFGSNKFAVDAEEESDTVEDFKSHGLAVTIVIDPIDGTLEYVAGSDKFSINVGLIEKGETIAVVVYFPKQKKLYLLDENKKSFLIRFDDRFTETSKEALADTGEPLKKVIYINDRVPDAAKENLKTKEFTLVEDSGDVLWPEALIRCIEGKYDCCIFYNAQVRDVLLGAFIENFPQGVLVDWKGKSQKWPQGGRFTTGIFGRKRVDPKIVEALNV